MRLLDRLSEASELAQSGAQGDVVGRLAPLLLTPSSIATGLPAGPDRLQALKLLQVGQLGTTGKPQLELPDWRPRVCITYKPMLLSANSGDWPTQVG